MIFAAGYKSCRLATRYGALTIAKCITLAKGTSKSAIYVTILYILAAVPLLAASTTETYQVRQKGQQFNPGVLSIQRGQTVEIINDDGELIHHAYVDSKTFSFDSGDQEPGSSTDIVFTVPGNFVVLCGIHPKMRLDVEVK
jgi:plastocyanin